MFQTFSALGDPTRFAIVERLLAEGELSAGDIQIQADMSGPAVSRHLKVLRAAGLVEQRAQAQLRLYRVKPEAVRAIHQWTLNSREFWEASLDRLANALKEDTDD